MSLIQFFNIVEIRTKIVSMSTFSIAVLYTLYTYGRFYWLHFTLMLFATLMVDMGTTAFNIYFDYRRGVDHSDYNREKEKILVHEGVAPGAAFLTAAALFLAAGVTGLIITFLTGWQVAAAGAFCMGVGYFYTGGPYPISRTPFGELFAGGFLGTVLFLITCFVMAGYLPDIPDLSWSTASASLPSFFLIASILTVNNTCDIEGDTAAGRRTFSIIAGRKAGETSVYILGFLGFASAVFLGLRGTLPWTIIPFTSAAAGISILEYLGMHRRGYSHSTKGLSMNSISKVFILYTASMLIGLIIGLISLK